MFEDRNQHLQQKRFVRVDDEHKPYVKDQTSSLRYGQVYTSTAIIFSVFSNVLHAPRPHIMIDLSLHITDGPKQLLYYILHANIAPWLITDLCFGGQLGCYGMVSSLSPQAIYTVNKYSTNTYTCAFISTWVLLWTTNLYRTFVYLYNIHWLSCKTRMLKWYLYFCGKTYVRHVIWHLSQRRSLYTVFSRSLRFSWQKSDFCGALKCQFSLCVPAKPENVAKLYHIKRLQNHNSTTQVSSILLMAVLNHCERSLSQIA